VSIEIHKPKEKEGPWAALFFLAMQTDEVTAYEMDIWSLIRKKHRDLSSLQRPDRYERPRGSLPAFIDSGCCESKELFLHGLLHKQGNRSAFYVSIKRTPHLLNAQVMWLVRLPS
jgi:hypothetical protein